MPDAGGRARSRGDTTTCPTCRTRCARCGGFRGSAARRRRPAAPCAPPVPGRIGRPSCRSTASTSTACSCRTCRMRCTRPTSPRRCVRRHGLEPFPTLPFFAPERAVVITGRPDSDRERTQAWLTRWGHGALPLECRPGAPAAQSRCGRALQGRDGDALGLHALRRKRRRTGAARRGARAASGGELVVGDRRARLADRRGGAAALTESSNDASVNDDSTPAVRGGPKWRSRHATW